MSVSGIVVHRGSGGGGAGGPSQATQSAIEAETNENTYIPPDLLFHSPGVAKAWADLDGVGTATLDANYNISSITDNGTGDYTFNLGITMSSANYSVVTGADTRGAAATPVVPGIVSRTTTACRIDVRETELDVGSTLDIDPLTVAIFGDV